MEETKSGLYEKWYYELNSLKKSIALIGDAIPACSLYELQHALYHLLIAKRFGPEAISELKKAKDHLKRSHLDYLKIKLKLLYENEKSQTENQEKFLYFTRNYLAAKLNELNASSQHSQDPITCYRNLIIKVMEVEVQKYQVDKQKDARLADNFQLINEEMEDLWTWFQLEQISYSLKNYKLYNIVYEMVAAYLTYNNFKEKLNKLNNILKLSIVLMTLQMPYADIFINTKNLESENHDFMILWRKYKSPASNEEKKELSQKLQNYLEPVFEKSLSFLGVSLHSFR